MNFGVRDNKMRERKMRDWNMRDKISGLAQVSAIADEPARRAASRQTCYKQRWMLDVINLQPN